jgi:hypothetical protein
MGGESQKASLNQATGYSDRAHLAYLEPNSQSMQKPVEGVYPRRFSSVLFLFPPLYKGAIVSAEHNRAATKTSLKLNTQ